MRIGERTAQGHKLEDFVDAWERFLPPRPSGTSGTSPPLSQADVPHVRDVPHARDGDEPSEWLVRDGKWRSFEDEPPAFPREVVETRGGSREAAR
jgi:hypothetical protein